MSRGDSIQYPLLGDEVPFGLHYTDDGFTLKYDLVQGVLTTLSDRTFS
jgi:hypothetical protein